MIVGISTKWNIAQPNYVQVAASAVENLISTFLSHLNTLSSTDSEDFEDFCINFGYDTDSIKALETWERVKEQDYNLKMVFSDEDLRLIEEVA